MKVQAVNPGAETGALLAGSQFSDAYSVAVEGGTLDARRAAERMLGRQPRWIEALMALRNYLVVPFGLKTPSPIRQASARTVGIFPVLSESPGRLVAGFDDRHLDFRVVVDVAINGDGQRVTATTLVLTHNLLGRTYLAIILPFHRVIVRSMLRGVAA
ncbi:DUF2867 domain-containing protein [Bradyrhizobium sp.]|uniref:DUF2867 domain-containing protein n=1 Tax=Bradyrhizobium sp. TaxID=376 RepID=UPI003C7495D2